MNLSFENRNLFLNELMERVKNFGMVFDISKMNKQNEIEKREQFKTDSKFRNFEKEKEKEKEYNNEIKEEKLDDEKEENNKKNKIEKKNDENNIDNFDFNINEKANEILGNKPNNINNDNESSTKEEEKVDN